MIKFLAKQIGKFNGEERHKWREETIRRMLNNKVYLGHLEYGKRINLSYKSKKVKYIPPDEWKIVHNTHEPIVTEELFNTVQSMRSMNKEIKKKKHEWELNGIVKCKECGAKMTLKVEYKRNNPSQIKSKRVCCLNGLKRYRGKECIKGSRGLDEKTLNTIVSESMKKIVKKLIDKDKIKDLLRKQNYDTAYKNYDNNKELFLKELKKIEDEITELYMDYKNELLDQEDYRRFQQEKTNQRNRIKKELELLEKEKQTKPVLTEKRLNDIVQELLNMKGLRKDIIAEIVHDIQIDNDNNVHINYKYNIFDEMVI